MNYFSSLITFLQMGGYANYVWPAYGIGLFILLTNLWIANKRLRSTLKKLNKKYANKT